MLAMFNIGCEDLAFLLSMIALIISYRTAYHETLSPPKLRWLTPMTYSLRDRLGCNRPAIAIAFNIHNSGARPGIIEDIAVRVIRQKPCGKVAAFQATVAWTWNPGRYIVEMYEGNPDGGWQMKASLPSCNKELHFGHRVYKMSM